LHTARLHAARLHVFQFKLIRVLLLILRGFPA